MFRKRKKKEEEQEEEKRLSLSWISVNTFSELFPRGVSFYRVSFNKGLISYFNTLSLMVNYFICVGSWYFVPNINVKCWLPRLWNLRDYQWLSVFQESHRIPSGKHTHPQPHPTHNTCESQPMILTCESFSECDKIGKFRRKKRSIRNAW